MAEICFQIFALNGLQSKIMLSHYLIWSTYDCRLCLAWVQSGRSLYTINDNIKNMNYLKFSSQSIELIVRYLLTEPFWTVMIIKHKNIIYYI